jgi:hypothetical protein
VRSLTTLKRPGGRTDSFLSVVGYLENELPILYKYLGDIAFGKLSKDLATANPAKANDSLVGALPEYLKRQASFEHRPEIYELACLEIAVNRAFLSPELPILTAQQFEAIAVQNFAKLKIHFVESAQFLTFEQNTTSIWAALKCDERPPKPHRLDEPQNVSVWKQRGSPRFRLLGAEEAKLFEQFRRKLNIKSAAKFLNIADDTEQAMARTLNYVRGWVDAELVALPVKD